ncbi:kelch-like protein 5 isoform X1 [Schistocerca serialis cubense]|uniref:kelch-like protein 5 isoform X1 n=2 Tax=Schistocerca serialis cubense TaxID=2023355 RepID=UPI00214EF5A2|nr:kelch-like protein 5 isoform X1 [Schistocerca serialis cubense]
MPRIYVPYRTGRLRDEPAIPYGDRTESSSSESLLDGNFRYGGSSPTLSSTTPDEKFTSQSHAEKSLARMENYFQSGQLTDVTLVAESSRIPAHRIVLSAASEYFAAMFTSKLRESTEHEIEMHEMDGNSLRAIVQYCYTGKVEIREETVEKLLSAARLLQMPEIVDACCGFLKKQLDPSNCIGIRLFADTQGCDDLMKAAHDYTTEHFMEVINREEFTKLSADEVEKLLKSDDLNVPCEENVFNALMTWIAHDEETRKKDVSRLLGLIKLPLLSPAFIVDCIEGNIIFKEDSVCRELVMEALKYHLLPERRPRLQSVRTRPRKSTVGSLYAVGGLDGTLGLTSIEKYDLRANKWSNVGHMNCRRLQFGVAVIDGRLYVVGGRDGLKTLNTAECFDFRARTWNVLPPMATHRHGLGVAVLEGPLYAVGGHDGWSYLNTVERWDPQARQWSFVASMFTQRSTVGVAVLNSKLYAVGGRDGSSCLRSVECYDPHTNKWTACAPMAKRRGGVGVGVANGYLYALGGHDAPISNPSASRFSCVERYDPKSDTWTTVASMSHGRDAIGVGLLGDRLFAVGGYNGHHYLKLVEAYDPEKNEWEEVAPLTTGRARLCVVVVKNP